MIIEKDYTFDSAHHLPNTPDGHKCKHMHGHTYKLSIAVEGKILTHEGWVMDFAEISKHVKPIIKTLDHKVLNDIPGLENPTAESIATYFFEQLRYHLKGLYSITVHETPTSRAILYAKK